MGNIINNIALTSYGDRLTVVTVSQCIQMNHTVVHLQLIYIVGQLYLKKKNQQKTKPHLQDPALNLRVHITCFTVFIYFFLAVPMARGRSWARD